jgi:hypothetical protein
VGGGKACGERLLIDNGKKSDIMEITGNLMRKPTPWG